MYRCCRCEEEFDEANIYIGEDDQQNYCCDCYNEVYTCCEHCEDYHLIDNMNWSDRDECYYCDDCYNEEDEDYMTIRNYHDRDIPLTFKKLEDEDTKLYYGFELEVENAQNDVSCESMATDIRENYNFLDLCFEQDGSLRDGFEIITQPMTHNYIEKYQNEFKGILEDLAGNGFQSHNGGRCGLHIHISKNALGKDDEEIEKNINKLLLFTETYKNELSIFSRRTDFGYCKFISDNCLGYNNNRFFKSTKILKEEASSKGRYQVINTENANTIEIRVFRGTLKWETFKATLDFTNNLINVILKNSTSKISWDKVINYNKTEELKNYIESKGIFNSSYMVDETKNIEKEYEKKVKIITELSTKYSEILMNVVNKIDEFCKEKHVNYKDITADNLYLMQDKARMIAQLNTKIQENLSMFIYKKDVSKFKDVFTTDINDFNNKINKLIDDITYIVRSYSTTDNDFVSELNTNKNVLKVDKEEGEI